MILKWDQCIKWQFKIWSYYLKSTLTHICVHIHISTHIYIHTCVHKHINIHNTHIHVYTHTHVGVHTLHTLIPTHMCCMHTAYMYDHTRICIYVCTCTLHVHVCIHTHTCTMGTHPLQVHSTHILSLRRLTFRFVVRLLSQLCFSVGSRPTFLFLLLFMLLLPCSWDHCQGQCQEAFPYIFF